MARRFKNSGRLLSGEDGGEGGMGAVDVGLMAGRTVANLTPGVLKPAMLDTTLDVIDASRSAGEKLQALLAIVRESDCAVCGVGDLEVAANGREWLREELDRIKNNKSRTVTDGAVMTAASAAGGAAAAALTGPVGVGAYVAGIGGSMAAASAAGYGLNAMRADGPPTALDYIKTFKKAQDEHRQTGKLDEHYEAKAYAAIIHAAGLRRDAQNRFGKSFEEMNENDLRQFVEEQNHQITTRLHVACSPGQKPVAKTLGGMMLNGTLDADVLLQDNLTRGMTLMCHLPKAQCAPVLTPLPAGFADSGALARGMIAHDVQFSDGASLAPPFPLKPGKPGGRGGVGQS